MPAAAGAAPRRADGTCREPAEEQSPPEVTGRAAMNRHLHGDVRDTCGRGAGGGAGQRGRGAAGRAAPRAEAGARRWVRYRRAGASAGGKDRCPPPTPLGDTAPEALCVLTGDAKRAWSDRGSWAKGIGSMKASETSWDPSPSTASLLLLFTSCLVLINRQKPQAFFARDNF